MHASGLLRSLLNGLRNNLASKEEPTQAQPPSAIAVLVRAAVNAYIKLTSVYYL
jgi:hypothetical protein